MSYAVATAFYSVLSLNRTQTSKAPYLVVDGVHNDWWDGEDARDEQQEPERDLDSIAVNILTEFNVRQESRRDL